MGGLTLDLQLQINEKEQLQEASLVEINTFVEEVIEKHKTNVAAINTLVLDSVATLSVVEARSDELASQGKGKKLWNGLTGKNQKIRGEIDRDLASAQYASQQMIQKLAEQNLLTFELITTINNRLSSMLNEVEMELNTVYETLITFFKQAKSNIVQLENRIEKLERSVNLINWLKIIEYQIIDGKEYSELTKMEKIICLTKDFYDLTEGNWTMNELLLLKATMNDLGVNVKEEICYRDFFICVIEETSMLEKLLGGAKIDKSINLEPHQAALIKGLEKYKLLQGEEHYVVKTILSTAVVEDIKSLEISLVRNYLKLQAIFDINKSVNTFDFINELLLNLSLFLNSTTNNTIIHEEYEGKINELMKMIEKQNEEVALSSKKHVELSNERFLIRVETTNTPTLGIRFLYRDYRLNWNVGNGDIIERDEVLGSTDIVMAGGYHPLNILSPSEGRIYFLVEDRSLVKENDIIAVVYNPIDNLEDILQWVKHF